MVVDDSSVAPQICGPTQPNQAMHAYMQGPYRPKQLIWPPALTNRAYVGHSRWRGDRAPGAARLVPFRERGHIRAYGQVLAEVEGGRSFVITRRGRPVADSVSVASFVPIVGLAIRPGGTGASSCFRRLRSGLSAQSDPIAPNIWQAYGSARTRMRGRSLPHRVDTVRATPSNLFRCRPDAASGHTAARFLAHGVRYMDPLNSEHLSQLRAGQRLSLRRGPPN
jgi:hypothetical protein